MKILVAGGGAVGTFVGGKLALAGNEMFLFNRHEDYCKFINENGCFVIEEGKTKNAKAKAFSTPDSIFREGKSFDLAIIAVKSFSTRPLLVELQPYLDRINEFLSLQNGLGNEEILLEFVEGKKIISGALTIACFMETTGKSEAANKGGIGLSPILTGIPVETAASLFRDAGFLVRVYPNWKEMKWSKLFLNSIANATAAILDMPAPEIFADKLAFETERKALLEILAVMEAFSILPVSLPCRPVPLYAWAVKHLPLPLLRLSFARKAGKGRGSKLASLHYDLQRGKTQTESPALYGKVVEKAKEKNIPVPALETLNRLVCEIAEKKIAAEKFKKNPKALYDLILEAVEVQPQPFS